MFLPCHALTVYLNFISGDVIEKNGYLNFSNRRDFLEKNIKSYFSIGRIGEVYFLLRKT